VVQEYEQKLGSLLALGSHSGKEFHMVQTQVTTPRKEPKQARARATIEAILAAAAQILVQDGFEAATTNSIAQRAGVSVGSLYQYFPSKEAVIFALVERHVGKMQRQLEEVIAEYSEAPLEEIVPTYVKAMLAAHRVEPRLHRVFSEQLPKLAGRDALMRWSEDAERVVRGVLYQHRDRLRPRDLEMAAFLLLHAVEAITHALVIFRPRYLEREALADEISELIMRYLLEPEAMTNKQRANGRRRAKRLLRAAP
jgi:AcrR family transcriptional regulator